MSFTTWEERGKRELEARVYCPKCGVTKFLTAHDTPYYFEVAARKAFEFTNCDKCGFLFKIKKTKTGVEIIK